MGKPCESTLAWSLVEDIAGFQKIDASGQLLSGGQIIATTLFLYFGGHLGWAHDVAPLTNDIRQTGPVFATKGFDTHQRVRIFYSDSVVDWLLGGREGDIPNGAIIVKQMYASNPENATYGADRASGWAVMIRNTNLSKDGWLWYLFFFPKSPPYNAPLPVFYGQTGDSFCLACHAAVDNKEMTFSSLANLQGARQAYSFSNMIDPGVFVSPGTPATGGGETSLPSTLLTSGITQFQKLGALPDERMTLLKTFGGRRHLTEFSDAIKAVKALSREEKDDYARKLLKGKLSIAESKIEEALTEESESAGTGKSVSFYVGLLEKLIADIEQVLGDDNLGEFADQLVELYLRTVMQLESQQPLTEPNKAILAAFSGKAKATLPKHVGDLKWFPLDFIFSHTPALPDQLPKEVCALHKKLDPELVKASFIDSLVGELENFVGDTEDCLDVFITSDNCSGCHWSYVLQGQVMPNMLAPEKVEKGANSSALPNFWDISPYAEWSASMMGLAGKDPIFHAQLSWEQEHNGKEMADRISNLCLRCHQPAAQRQFHLDNGDKGKRSEKPWSGAPAWRRERTRPTMTECDSIG